MLIDLIFETFVNFICYYKDGDKGEEKKKFPQYSVHNIFYFRDNIN